MFTGQLLFLRSELDTVLTQAAHTIPVTWQGAAREAFQHQLELIITELQRAQLLVESGIGQAHHLQQQVELMAAPLRD